MATRILTLAGVVLLLAAGTPSAAQDLKMYTWHDFQLTYPSHWSIALDQDVGEAHQIRLVSDQAETSSIILNLLEEFPAPDEAYTATPVMASVSFGLDVALQLAGEYGESAIAVSYGNIQLADGPALTARFMVTAPDPEMMGFYTLDCFHARSEDTGSAFFGMLLNTGTRGKIIDNPTYHQYISEAYTIAKSVVIN